MGEATTGMRIEAEARTWLLERARETIAAMLEERPLEAGPSRPASVEQPGGCFVTLHAANGALRGCIGTFAATDPLWRAVEEMAVAAATRDPRFVAVGRDELDTLHLEISVLTPLRPASAAEVEVGRHGIAVHRGYHRGVLLPQVATEQGWDRETFLDHTCMKAGLPPQAWRDGSVEIELFEAEVFGEP